MAPVSGHLTYFLFFFLIFDYRHEDWSLTGKSRQCESRSLDRNHFLLFKFQIGNDILKIENQRNSYPQIITNACIGFFLRMTFYRNIFFRTDVLTPHIWKIIIVYIVIIVIKFSTYSDPNPISKFFATFYKDKIFIFWLDNIISLSRRTDTICYDKLQLLPVFYLAKSYGT